MTYTDEELVRELEYKYPECELVKQACERLIEILDETECEDDGDVFVIYREDGE